VKLPITLETHFVVVPAGLRRVLAGWELNARVVVEWFIPKGESTPPWLENWGETAQNLRVGVHLSTDDGSGGSFVAVPRDPETAPEETTARTSVRLTPSAAYPRVVDNGTLINVDDLTKRNTARAKAIVAGDKEVPTVPAESPVLAFARAYNPHDGFAPSLFPFEDQIISSRVATRHPELARRLSLAWDVKVRFAGTTLPDGLRVWAQAEITWLNGTDPTTGKTVLPFTKTTFRTNAGVNCWVPLLEADNPMASAEREGLIRMIGPKATWRLESIEYVGGELQDSSATTASARSGRPIQDSGGLALVCRGIQAFSTVPHVDEYKVDREGVSQPVLAWADLVAGLRVDVQSDVEGKRKWNSLSLRRVRVDRAMPTDDEAVQEWGTHHALGNEEPWRFEETLRWNGLPLTPAAEEKIQGRTVKSEGRPSPEARLRWGQTYSMALRPVFKGGWSLTTDQATLLRQGWAAGATAPVEFLREEPLGAPIVRGLKEDGEVHRLFCSLDQHGVAQEHVFKVTPPKVSKFLVKRSGELDAGLSSSEQEGRLNRAAANYPSDSTQTGESARLYPDPWADQLHVEVVLAGTSSADSSITEAKGLNGADLQHGERRFVRVPWRRLGEWPWFSTVTVRIVAGHSTRIRTAGHEVVIELAKGDHADVALRPVRANEDSSSGVFGGFGAAKFALTSRLRGTASFGSENASPDFVLGSRLHTLLTHSVRLECKHATRAPLESPQMTKPEVARALGDVEGRLEDLVRVDRQTTSEMVLEAKWQDWEPEGDRMVLREKTFDKGPTWAIALAGNGDYGRGGEASKMETVSLRVPLPDTRHRLLVGSLRGSARYGSHFTGGGVASSGRLFGMLVKNSAVPTAPEVSLIVPAMTVKDEVSQEVLGRRSWRHDFTGNLLRVYLGQRWFLTGPGELLGVVCAPESQEGLDDSRRRAMKPYFSQWGSEVLLATPGVKEGPFARSFPARALTFDGVKSFTGHEGDQFLDSAVAGHTVLYDDERREFYADVALAGHGTDYPWVRLGLVRLQPESTAGAFVSPTVVAQFAQPLADRWIVASEAANDPRSLRISARCTRAAQDLDVAQLSASVTAYRQSETSDQDGIAHRGHWWTPIPIPFNGQQSVEVPLTMYPKQGDADEHRYWLGELRMPDTEKALLVVRESFTPPMAAGETIPYAKITRWTGILEVRR